MNINNEHFKIDDLSDFKITKLEFNDPNFSLWDYVNYKSTWDLAVGFSKIFWPDFIVYNGYIFLAEKNNPEQVNEWVKAFHGNQREVELMVNHVHVYDLFGGMQNIQPTESILNHIGKTLSVSWELALKLKFPDIAFEVHFSNELQDYGPSITFCQANDMRFRKH